MLKLELTITDHEFVPTKYELQDKHQSFPQLLKPKKKFFTVDYAYFNAIGGWDQCTLYCSRKFDITGCENDGIRAIKFGGEFYDGKNLYKDGISKRDKQYFCFDRRFLTKLKQMSPERYFNRKKRELPAYLLRDNLTELKQIVDFHINNNNK